MIQKQHITALSAVGKKEGRCCCETQHFGYDLPRLEVQYVLTRART